MMTIAGSSGTASTKHTHGWCSNVNWLTSHSTWLTTPVHPYSRSHPGSAGHVRHASGNFGTTERQGGWTGQPPGTKGGIPRSVSLCTLF